ncbi:MAG TPA: GNAT family N-acetyltransferase, partial [Allocoleopsis sp.]
MRLKVQLIRSQDNSPFEAYIVELTQKHIDDYENLWRESLRTFQTEDKFWDWVFKLEFITRQENHSGYAIEC